MSSTHPADANGPGYYSFICFIDTQSGAWFGPVEYSETAQYEANFEVDDNIKSYTHFTYLNSKPTQTLTCYFSKKLPYTQDAESHGFSSATEEPAKLLDDNPRESYDIGNGITFQVCGSDRDVARIVRGGQILSNEGLYNTVRRAGRITEVKWQLVGGDGNVAFRFGRDNDLMYAIAVRGMQRPITTYGVYMMHPYHNVQIDWPAANLARYRGGPGGSFVDKYLRFDDNTRSWILS